MESLEHQVVEFQDALEMLPYSEIRVLERSLTKLTPTQRTFVDNTLEQAQLDALLPVHEVSLLEYLFERWSTHGLALKLILIGRIEQLTDTCSWPDDVLRAYPAIDAVVRPAISAAFPQCEDAEMTV